MDGSGQTAWPESKGKRPGNLIECMNPNSITPAAKVEPKQEPLAELHIWEARKVENGKATLFKVKLPLPHLEKNLQLRCSEVEFLHRPACRWQHGLFHKMTELLLLNSHDAGHFGARLAAGQCQTNSWGSPHHYNLIAGVAHEGE